jgi:Zn finger protein HypA/HybF involved in hydrogenase expression
MDFDTNKIYCYCNDCKEISSSRLRFVCQECRTDAIMISKEPKSFKDILEECQISAICLNEMAHGVEEYRTFSKFYQKCNKCNSSDTQILPNVQPTIFCSLGDCE